MHDAGEKDTPPSDRLVVARKPLLPTPYARFYSSTRFRSVSAPLPNSDPGAILVAPPLPAARFEANRSSLVSSRITMLENARPFAHPIDPRRVAILWSILPRVEEGQVIIREFRQNFLLEGFNTKYLINWGLRSIEFDTYSESYGVCVRAFLPTILFSISKELLERGWWKI